jgi:hypothetical protein
LGPGVSGVGLGVFAGVGLGVALGVLPGVGLGVALGVGLGVALGVGLGVALGVGLGDGSSGLCTVRTGALPPASSRESNTALTTPAGHTPACANWTKKLTTRSLLAWDCT